MPAQIKFGRKRLSIGFRLKKVSDTECLLQPLSNMEIMKASEFVPLLKSKDFVLKLCSKILETGFKAIDFESSVIDPSSMSNPFHIKITESATKKGMYPSYKQFSRHMNSWGSVQSVKIPDSNDWIVFPSQTDRDFSHMITFLKNSDDDEKFELWQKISDKINAGKNKKQFGTSEQNIPWLNIGIAEVD